MNYLKYKKNFPKSINLFFDWVSKENPVERHTDNIYFLKFFSQYFDYRERLDEGYLIIDADKEYFQQLKSELMSRSLEYNYNYYFAEKSRIRFGVYSDTEKEFIRIIIKSESAFERAFFILEILLENAYYGRK